MESRAVELANGWQWIVDGWKLFRKNPLIWIVLVVVTVLLSIIVSLLPVVGTLALTLIYPVIAAGFMIGCRALDNGEELEIAHLFAGFTTRLGDLLAVGVVHLVGSLTVLLIAGLILGGSTLTAVLIGWGSTGYGDAAAGAVLGAVLALLVAGALLIPLLMAVWFAPPLIVLHGVRAIDAIRASFFACLRNILPLMVYGAVLFVLSIVASIPLFLGWLALGPVLVATLYTSYQDIFPRPRSPVQAASSFA